MTTVRTYIRSFQKIIFSENPIIILLKITKRLYDYYSEYSQNNKKILADIEQNKLKITNSENIFNLSQPPKYTHINRIQ